MATLPGNPGDAPAVDFAGVSCPADAIDDGAAALALADVVLSIAAGEFVVLLGPHGSGKTALLNLAAGLAVPSTGSIRIFGKPLSGINRRAGYLLQTDSLLPWRDARGNVAAGPQFAGAGPAESRRKADDWLDRLGLATWAGCLPHQLSPGLRKRVALAQALAANPEILLLDDPFAGIDLPSRQRMEAVLLEQRGMRRDTLLMATRSLDDAITLADRVVLLSAGPASQPIGNFPVPLERPRDAVEVRMDRRFLQLQERIGSLLRDEALRTEPSQRRRQTAGIA